MHYFRWGQLTWKITPDLNDITHRKRIILTTRQVIKDHPVTNNPWTVITDRLTIIQNLAIWAINSSIAIQLSSARCSGGLFEEKGDHNIEEVWLWEVRDVVGGKISVE